MSKIENVIHKLIIIGLALAISLFLATIIYGGDKEVTKPHADITNLKYVEVKHSTGKCSILEYAYINNSGGVVLVDKIETECLR